MGKKRDNNKGKSKRVVLSLAEFNEEHASASVPDASALPTAPKALEDWEREGGRPEYNQRGYKERQPRPDRSSAYDDDFDDRDWTRKGPLDDDGEGFGNPGAERDWGDMRRGPLDAPDDGGAPRDWDSMRRGPVDSAFEGRAGGEVDWNARKGPVDAAGGAAAPVSDEAWSGARKGPVEAEFSAAENRDWTARKPVESAAAENEQQEADWAAPRKGPVDSQFESAGDAGRDWSARKGPVDAELPDKPRSEVNWAGMRSGSGVDAAAPAPAKEEEESTNKPEEPRKDDAIDWSARRGPIKSRDESEKPAPRAVDFSEVRRGAKLPERPEHTAERKEEGEREADSAGRWRRGRGGGRPASTGFDGPSQAPRERDWRSARVRSHPVNAAVADAGGASQQTSGEQEKEKETATATTNGGEADKTGEWEKDDEWTTVRSATNRREGRGGFGGFARRGAVRGGRRGGFSGNRGPRAEGEARHTPPVAAAARPAEQKS